MYRAVMKTPFGLHYGKNRKMFRLAQDDLCGEIEGHMSGAGTSYLFETTTIRDGVITVAGAEFWVEKCGYRETSVDLSFFDATVKLHSIRRPRGYERDAARVRSSVGVP